jgi:hypothetical protein
LAPDHSKLILMLPAGFDFAGVKAYVLSDCADQGLSLSGNLVSISKATRGKNGTGIDDAIPPGFEQSIISATYTVRRGDDSGFFEFLDRNFPENAKIAGVPYSGIIATFCPETGGYCDGGRALKEGRFYPATASLWTNEASYHNKWLACGDGDIDSTYMFAPVIRGAFMAVKNLSLLFKKRC